MKHRLFYNSLTIALLLQLLCVYPINANDFKLPDLGTPSDSALSPIKEKEIRDDIFNQIYTYDLVMNDPIVVNYIESLGFKLALNSENPHQPFDFFVVDENVVNASTYPGGLILIFSGLLLRSETESELAAVVAHEIAHATQRHMSRFYANAKKNTIPMLLGMLGAVAASKYSNSRDAPIAIAVGVQALQQQSMINFTRLHEYEADRVGIDTLKKSGFNPLGMSGFFEKLMRENPVDQRYKLPEFLRTHPLSVNRVAEAKNRAKPNKNEVFKESKLYEYVKERVRVFTETTELDNSSYYTKLFAEKSNSGEITGAQKYGYALALNQSHDFKKALDILSTIKAPTEVSLLISVLKANIYSELDWQKSNQQFKKLLDFYPENPIVIEAYIAMLAKQSTFKNKKKARFLARNLVNLFPDNPNYYGILAIVNQNAGMSIEANEALAIKQHKTNNNYKAVRILKNILKGKLDYYQRARIEAKITAYENLITDKERHREIQEEKTGRERF